VVVDAPIEAPIIDDYVPTIVEEPPPPIPAPVPVLETDTHMPYVRGFPDGSFHPERPITRAEVALALFQLIGNQNANSHITGERFSDVGNAHWHSQAIHYLTNVGVLRGFPDGTFRPDDPMTRAELTATLSRLFAINGSSNNFPDVQGHWANTYISAAVSHGWMEGFGDGTFRPDNAITRAETVRIINRAFGRNPHPQSVDYLLNNNIFPDVSRSHWAFYDIMAAALRHEFVLYENDTQYWVWVEN